MHVNINSEIQTFCHCLYIYSLDYIKNVWAQMQILSFYSLVVDIYKSLAPHSWHIMQENANIGLD